MDQIKSILEQIYTFIKCSIESRYIREDFRLVSEPERIDLKGYNAIYIKNGGEVTALVNGVISIEPSSFYVSSNLSNNYFSEPYTLTFDDANSLGKNTGTIKRLELAIKKEQGMDYKNL